MDWIDNIEWSRRPKRLPVVFTVEEVTRILLLMEAIAGLMAGLLYGSGLRLQECLSLRIMDLDFGYHQIIVRDGKCGGVAVVLPYEAPWTGSCIRRSQPGSAGQSREV